MYSMRAHISLLDAVHYFRHLDETQARKKKRWNAASQLQQGLLVCKTRLTKKDIPNKNNKTDRVLRTLLYSVCLSVRSCLSLYLRKLFPALPGPAEACLPRLCEAARCSQHCFIKALRHLAQGAFQRLGSFFFSGILFRGRVVLGRTHEGGSEW